MIIVTMSHSTSLEQREPYIAGHKQFIKSCIEAGTLIAAGPTDGFAGGVLLMNADSSEVTALMKQDPFIIHAVSEYTLTSFTIKAGQQNYLSLEKA